MIYCFSAIQLTQRNLLNRIKSFLLRLFKNPNVTMCHDGACSGLCQIVMDSKWNNCFDYYLNLLQWITFTKKHDFFQAADLYKHFSNGHLKRRVQNGNFG